MSVVEGGERRREERIQWDALPKGYWEDYWRDATKTPAQLVAEERQRRKAAKKEAQHKEAEKVTDAVKWLEKQNDEKWWDDNRWRKEQVSWFQIMIESVVGEHQQEPKEGNEALPRKPKLTHTDVQISPESVEQTFSYSFLPSEHRMESVLGTASTVPAPPPPFTSLKARVEKSRKNTRRAKNKKGKNKKKT